MIKYTKLFITILFAVSALGAVAQTTANTSSPYSQYGLGDLTPMILPQNQAMGGISTGTNIINRYMSNNPQNPASNAMIGLTTIDAGLSLHSVNLNQNGQPAQRNSNFRLSHLTFAVPVSQSSALAFGLLPYSQVGYNYTKSSRGFGTGSSVDTNLVNNIYSGQGGLTKAYFGYGFAIKRNLLLGANVGYVFGNIKHFQQIEMPELFGSLNTRVERNNAAGGFTYDLGAQYVWDLSLTRHVVFGYSTSASSKINSKHSYIISHYTFDSAGNENADVDSIVNEQNAQSKINLPSIHRFGISYQQDMKFLVGVDYSMGKWSDLTINGVNAGMANSSTLNVGGQFTPKMDALKNYLATIDYRLGFILDKTYYNVPNPSGGGSTNIKSKAVTFGVGLPLRGNITSFYKMNISAEVGQRGTLSNGLVKENYFNVRLGFTLNDRWFQRYKFD